MPYQPPPPPRTTPGGAYAGGIIRPGEPFVMLIDSDITDYEAGYQAGAAGDPPNDRTPWWRREGWQQAVAKRPKLTLTYGQLAPTFAALAPVKAEEVAYYEQGYRDGEMGSTVPGPDQWWYKYGRADGKAKRGRFPLVADQPPPPFPRFVDAAPPVPPGAQAIRYPVFELAANILGRRVPYDVAVRLEQLPIEQLPTQTQLGGIVPIAATLLVALVNFDLIGGGPLDEEEGYGLAGKNGRLARYIKRLADRGAINPNPNAYGLPAWVGARLKSGRIRILSALELRRIGVYEQLLEAVGA